MSGIVKSVKKVFKKIGDAVKKIVKSPIFKAVVIAAAIYFTAGAAMNAFAASGTAVAETAGAIELGAATTGVTESAFMGEGLLAGAEAASGAAAAAGDVIAMGENVGSVLEATEAAITGGQAGVDVVAQTAANAAPEAAQAVTQAVPDASQGIINSAAEPVSAAATPPAPAPSGPAPTPAPTGAPAGMTEVGVSTSNPMQVASLDVPQAGFNFGPMVNPSEPTSLLGDAWSAFRGLPTGVQSGIIQGGMGMVQGAVGSYNQQQAEEAARRERARRGYVPDMTGAYSPRGIINGARG